MRPFTTLARPLVAAPFIVTGLDALRDPRERAERVGPMVKPVADRFDRLPKDPETLVRIQGAVSLGTGALLLTGRFPRLTTLLLAAQLVPALATEHHYWTEDDPARRADERSHLLKNAGLLGALLLAASERGHVPRRAELRRQLREQRIKSGAEAKLMRKEAALTLRDARREASRQVRTARAEARSKGARTSGRASGVLKAGKAGGLAVSGAAGGALKGAGGAFRIVRPAKPSRATRAGRTVKAGTAAQAAKAVKAGRTVKAGTAVQAGKIKQAVKH
ncbi:DoxX family membrane protein [Actinomadura syzygii]|uniref:DoxX family membrane protein n=1 Tax=Actinomadura syzygii TaxID=1427538 RepID=A0A5D0U7Y3_9ACTN|nr:DoxX family membrane protein [Actinomadura syzygii]TYC13880.1 DoxX family membrane protein [Actinomadura syzygii]